MPHRQTRSLGNLGGSQLEDDGMSLALLLDRRFSVPHNRMFSQPQQQQQYRQQLEYSNGRNGGMYQLLDMNDMSRRMSVPQPSESSVPPPLPLPLGSGNGILMSYSFPQSDTMMPKYVPMEMLNSQLDQMEGLPVGYMFPQQQQPQQQQNQLQQLQQPQQQLQLNLKQPQTLEMSLFSNSQSLLQQQPAIMGNNAGSTTDQFYSFQQTFSPLMTPQPNYFTMTSIPTMTPSDTRFELTTQTAPSTPILTYEPSPPTPKPVKTTLVPAKKLFRTTPEPGLDLLLNSPSTSPANLLAARRNSVTESSRPARFKPTEAELVLLVAIFKKNPFPSAQLRQKLADKMGLDIKQVQFWFQNRRATMKVQGIIVTKPKRGAAGSVHTDTQTFQAVSSTNQQQAFSLNRTSLSPLSADPQPQGHLQAEDSQSQNYLSFDASINSGMEMPPVDF